VGAKPLPRSKRTEVIVARVTTEDCLARVSNHFALVILAAERARQLTAGAVPLVSCNNRAAVTSLREIALGRVGMRESLEAVVGAFLTARRETEHQRRVAGRGAYRAK
jgi:DNA-directed RNA polymerase subunit omega